MLLKASEFLREWTFPHVIYYSYFGKTFNIVLRKGRLLGALKLPKPGHDVDAVFLPLPSASAPGSENHGSPGLCEVMSLLFNETNG